MTSVFHPQTSERGFALVVALFVLLALAVFGSYLLTMSTVQSHNSVLSLQGARGYHAARSGIEWGLARALAGNCAANTNFSVPGTAFTVNVSCQAQNFSEGGISYNVYRLVSLAETGNYGDEDYLSRRLEMKVGP